MQYYVQYPALTILFYPPLFYAVAAPFYAIFGVSHATEIHTDNPRQRQRDDADVHLAHHAQRDGDDQHRQRDDRKGGASAHSTRQTHSLMLLA